MTPEQILAIAPRVLTQAQREFYFNEGYLLVPGVIDPDWLGRLRGATAKLVDRSRAVTKSDEIFDLEPGHRSDAPRLRRVSRPVEHGLAMETDQCGGRPVSILSGDELPHRLGVAQRELALKRVVVGVRAEVLQLPSDFGVLGFLTAAPHA